MHNKSNIPSGPFIEAFRGRLAGIRQWQELDAFWELLKKSTDDKWYIYTIGEPVPAAPASREQLVFFVNDINKRLRQEHEEDYCGIVYVDDKQQPAFIKIYDPGNLGVVCGFSDSPPLPGWILSRVQPVELNEQIVSLFQSPQKKRRWWQRFLKIS